MFAMSLLNPIKTFEFMTHRAYDVRLCRRCSTFDGRCRTSKLLQPLNMIPHGEVQHKSPRKFEDISSKSSRLLVDLGFVRPASPGTFVFLNMAMRSLEKLTSLADVVMEQAGCQKILLPTLTERSIWEKTGRLEKMEGELLTTVDRSGKGYIFSPTHEEAVTSLIAGLPLLSHKSLPLQLYQISIKYRDELRPKFGLIRSKEFLMKDLYTFDKDLSSASETYERITEAYHNFFRALGVPYVSVAGSAGSMGGSISHEFHFPADIGQDRLLVCPECECGTNLEVSDHKTIPDCSSCRGSIELEERKAIEVGHTFLLGDKYSSTLGAKCQGPDGKPAVMQMGCYGLGLSRILAASVEVLSTEKELRWPDAIVPFNVCIVCPKEGSNESKAVGSSDLGLYDDLVNDLNLVRDVILDDRENLTVGKKFREAFKTGYRIIVVFGKQVLEADAPKVEIHCTKTSKNYLIPISEAVSFIDSLLQDNDEF